MASPYRSTSVKLAPFKSALFRLAPLKLAFVRSEPDKSTLLRSTLLILVSLRLAFSRSVLLSLVFVKSILLKLAYLKLAPLKLALLKLALLKLALPRSILLRSASLIFRPLKFKYITLPSSSAMNRPFSSKRCAVPCIKSSISILVKGLSISSILFCVLVSIRPSRAPPMRPFYLSSRYFYHYRCNSSQSQQNFRIVNLLFSRDYRIVLPEG